MDLEAIFTNLNAVTLLAVFAGGASLGLYFAVLNKFKRAEQVIAGIVSFVVIGWSFYLPFAFASKVTNPEADPLRFVGSMVLWVVFTLATTVFYQAAAFLAALRRKDRRAASEK